MKRIFVLLLFISTYVSASPKRFKICLASPYNLSSVKIDSLSSSYLAKADNLLQFHEGFLLGLESITNSNFEYDLSVIDLSEDSLAQLKYVESPQGKSFDLIVFNNQINPKVFIKSELMQGNGTGWVQVLFNNGLKAHATTVANFISQNYFRNNFVIIRSNNATDISIAKNYKTELKKAFNDSIAEFIPTSFDPNSWISKFKKDEVNFVLVTSTEEVFSTSVIRTLHKISKNYTVVVLGMPNWESFKTIDPTLFEDLHVIISNNNAVDFMDEKTSQFRKVFIDRFYKEPQVYGFKGFDFASFLGICAVSDNPSEEFIKPFQGLQILFKLGKDWKSKNVYNNQVVSILQFSDFSFNRLKYK